MTRPKCNKCGNTADFRCYIMLDEDESHTTYAINRCRKHMNEKEYIEEFNRYEEPYDPRPLWWNSWALSDGKLHEDYVISLEELLSREKSSILRLPNKFEVNQI